MNTRLQQLMDRSFTDEQGERFDPERFAELIVADCIDELRHEWYDLNNGELDVLGDARATAILVGQKNGVLKSISKIKKHFGVKE